MALGGSISAEHGIGVAKREEIRRYKSPVEIALMRRIKQALDPQGDHESGQGRGVLRAAQRPRPRIAAAPPATRTP